MSAFLFIYSFGLPVIVAVDCFVVVVVVVVIVFCCFYLRCCCTDR